MVSILSFSLFNDQERRYYSILLKGGEKDNWLSFWILIRGTQKNGKVIYSALVSIKIKEKIVNCNFL